MVGRFESGKDIVQEITESTANHVGKITTIITDAVGQIAKEIGELINDGMEMREARSRAVADHERESDATIADRTETELPHSGEVD